MITPNIAIIKYRWKVFDKGRLDLSMPGRKTMISTAAIRMSSQTPNM
jgi:hypothetical protein